MHATKVRYHAALALALTAGFVGTAHAQYAVGNGRALESPLQTRLLPGVDQSRRSFANELEFRNSIVSGTAPSGLSFRGGRLPSQFEFRGELGEDALFAYRRDSLYSGLAGRGIRGTDALQYQVALTTGARVPATLAGQLSYARAGASERTVTDLTQTDTRNLIPGFDNQLRKVTPDEDLMVSAVEMGQSLVQPVRSLSTYTANRGMQPTLVGLMQNRVTHLSAGQTASPLLGVQVVPVDSLRNPGATSPSLAEPGSANPFLANPARANPGQINPAQQGATTPAQPGVTGGTPAFQGVNPAAAPGPKPAYEQLIDRFRGLSPAPAPDAKGPPVWATDLVSVQRALRGVAGPEPVSRATPGQDEPNPYEGAFDRQAPDTIQPELGAQKPTTPSTFDMDVLRRVRQAGGMTDTLIPTELPRVDRYTAYMRTGQDMLAAERYFDAEEHFISAMSSRPNDVNALVGRAHAQIGAGLYLSAGLNIRQLLVQHPEVAGMRYGAPLLPAAARMEQVAANFREALRSPTSGADSGLLLAYLGFQRGQEQDIRDGLSALETAGDDADRRLAHMLRVVWLGEGVEDSPADGG